MLYGEYPDWDRIEEVLLHQQQNSSVPMIDPDMPTFMRRQYAFSEDDLEDADVAIVGAPYAVGDFGKTEYGGIDIKEWAAGPKRVRQQSAKYSSGHLTSLDVDVFDQLKVVDYGDAEVPPDLLEKAPPNIEEILDTQKAVEEKVNDVLDAGAIPIVLGMNSPASSYGVSKPLLERTEGDLGMISLDTHWDAMPIDTITMDPRVAGGGSWKTKMYEWHDNARRENVVEIGERGFGDVLGDRSWLDDSNFYSMYEVRNEGIEYLCDELRHAYDGTDSVFLHFDMDVMGGGGSAPGDLFGRLAEPMGMSDHELMRISYEVGKRGFDALSYLAIMPGSQVMYRTVVYSIMYALAGLAESRND